MSQPIFPLPDTVAWGDESARTKRNPRMYLMCATAFEPGCERELSEFAKQKPAGMRKLHWYDMDAKQKARSLDALAEVPHWSTVAIMSPLGPNVRLERGRRKCLERLLPHLEEAGIEKLVLESRWKQEDQADVDMVSALRSRKMIKRIWVEHETPDAGDPRLWVPDQVLGAIGDMLCNAEGTQAWQHSWAKIDTKVTLLMGHVL